MELESVIGSNSPRSLREASYRFGEAGLFEHDDYIKTYLQENPEPPISSVIKIAFSYCITPRLIAEIDEFKIHFKAVNFFMFEDIFGKTKAKQARI